MKFLNKLFSDGSEEKENATFTLFKQAFPKGTDFSNFKVYHIVSFEYSDANMELFDENMNDKDFYKILDKLEYNFQSNNVGIYYVISPDGKAEVYIIADPLELLEKEYIMRKYEEILDEKIMKLSTVEQIN
jgi:hypothetical protein